MEEQVGKADLLLEQNVLGVDDGVLNPRNSIAGDVRLKLTSNHNRILIRVIHVLRG
jgi:hypothetical protein